MSQYICPQCGAPLDPNESECKFCGEKIAVQQQPQQFQQVQQRPQPQQAAPTVIVQQQPAYVSGINPSWPVKSKITAGLLAILFGSFGIHKFYLGETAMGILYLIFCWTTIPCYLGVIEGIIYLFCNKENFQLKHHVRLK